MEKIHVADVWRKPQVKSTLARIVFLSYHHEVINLDYFSYGLHYSVSSLEGEVSTTPNKRPKCEVIFPLLIFTDTATIMSGRELGTLQKYQYHLWVIRNSIFPSLQIAPPSRMVRSNLLASLATNIISLEKLCINDKCTSKVFLEVDEIYVPQRKEQH